MTIGMLTAVVFLLGVLAYGLLLWRQSRQRKRCQNVRVYVDGGLMGFSSKGGSVKLDKAPRPGQTITIIYEHDRR